MIEYYETVEGCLMRQPVLKVLLVFQHFNFMECNCPMFAPVNSTQILTSSWKNWQSEVGVMIKKLLNWLRPHYSHDHEQIQLEVAGEVLLYTSGLFICNFHNFSTPKGHFGQIQYFFNTFNTAWEPC